MPTNAAARILDAADRMQSDIERKFESARNMRALPPTRKRTQDSQGIYNDGVRLEKIQRALRKLADLHEAGTITDELKAITSRAAAERAIYRNAAFTALYESEQREETAAEKCQRLERQFLLQKIPGFFPTPRAEADELVASVGPIREGEILLEPGAGTGALIDAALRVQPGLRVHYFERNYSLADFLDTKYSDKAQVCSPGRDFTEFNLAEYAPRYDVILMNPPFENGQDAEHIERAYQLLKPGGRLAAIAGNGVFFRSDKKAARFREFLEETDARTRDIEDGAFKSSGTGVSCKSILIRKPLDAAKQEAAISKRDMWLADLAGCYRLNPEAAEAALVATPDPEYQPRVDAARATWLMADKLRPTKTQEAIEELPLFAADKRQKSLFNWEEFC